MLIRTGAIPSVEAEAWHVIIGSKAQSQSSVRQLPRVNPHRRYMQSCNPQDSSAEPMSLPDRIERIGRALTAGELASMLTVSRITIFKQAKAGRIPSFRIGTCVRFDPKTVAQWLREM